MSFIFTDIIYCFAAVFLYSLLMNAPRGTAYVSAAAAAAGYIVYDSFYRLGGLELAGYFAGTLVIAVFGEIMARIMKMPYIIFVFPAVIPLVPGVGLYRTVLAVVGGNFGEAAKTGTDTLFIAALMAAAIALINLFARHFLSRR